MPDDKTPAVIDLEMETLPVNAGKDRLEGRWKWEVSPFIWCYDGIDRRLYCMNKNTGKKRYIPDHKKEAFLTLLFDEGVQRDPR